MEGIDELIRSGLVIILFSSFLKSAVALSILSFGFGLDRFGMGLATLGLALVVSFVVMGSNDTGPKSTMSSVLSGEVLSAEVYKGFVEKHADPELIETFNQIRKTNQPESPPSFEITSAAFLATELREAFSLGFILLIPLVVIDLLVVNLLMALGITQISTSIISVPLKILLFVAVDGWALLTEKLISSYM